MPAPAPAPKAKAEGQVQTPAPGPQPYTYTIPPANDPTAHWASEGSTVPVIPPGGIYTTSKTMPTMTDVITTDGATEIDLPDARSRNELFTLKNIERGSVTVQPFGSQKIDGQSTISLASEASVTLSPVRGNWTIIGAYTP